MNLKKHLQSFQGLVLDADGVFFDGKETRSVTLGNVRAISKTRDYRDGQGISFLRALGIRILFATGEDEPLRSIVDKMNALPSCESGAWAPVECMTGLKSGKAAAVLAWGWAPAFPIVYMGDDRADCEAMRMTASNGSLVVIPADAQRCVRKYAGLTLSKRGGAGAIREFAEMVCDARGIDEETLATS